MLQANQIENHQYEHLALTDCRGEDSKVVCWSSYGPHNTLFQCKHWIITPPGAGDRYHLISGGSFKNNLVFEFWIMTINFNSEMVPWPKISNIANETARFELIIRQLNKTLIHKLLDQMKLLVKCLQTFSQPQSWWQILGVEPIPACFANFSSMQLACRWKLYSDQTIHGNENHINGTCNHCCFGCSWGFEDLHCRIEFNTFLGF